MPFDPDDTPPPQGPPDAPPQGPPRGDHTNLSADPHVWAAARAAYVEGGMSCPVVAERHGLVVRTVQHRARVENWPAMRARHAAVGVRREREAARDAELDDPACELVESLRADRLAGLLMHPSGEALVAEAARRAAEAEANGCAQETLLWLRVVHDADRLRDPIDRALAGRDPVDAFRTLYLQGVAAGCADREAVGGDGSPGG